MIKKKLSTIAFVSFISGSEALAQSIPNELLQTPNTPIVTVGGFINFSGVIRQQSKDFSKDRLPDATMTNGAVDTDPIKAGTNNRYSNRLDFVNDSEIYIKVGAISDSGLKYGAIVELEADTSPNGRGNGFNADKSFIFTESTVGKFEFGNNLAANQKMKVGPANFARATGGINGKYLEHINMPMLANSTQLNANQTAICDGGVGDTACSQVKLSRFILIPQSPVGHGGYAKGFYNKTTDNSDYGADGASNPNPNDYGSFNRNSLVGTGNNLGYKNGSFGQMEDATKISYYTPRINGWQLGGSFTPDTGDTGTSAVISGRDSGDIKNVASWGLNYSDTFGNLGFAMSATGERGQFENSKLQTAGSVIKREGLQSYDAGMMMTYFGFTIGGSYGYWGKSLQLKQGVTACNYDSNTELASQDCVATSTYSPKKFAGAKYYTGGAAYEFGPFAASLTYMASNFQNNKYKAASFGVDYKLARGLMPYFEVTKFQFDTNKVKALDVTSTAQMKDNKGYVALIGILFAF